MNNIKIILEFKDIFDEKPQPIDSYLNGINKQILIGYAIYYCSLSTMIIPDNKNILFAFLREYDKDIEFFKILKIKISHIINNSTKNPVILNNRTSLKFFELVKGRKIQNSIDLSDSEVRQRLLKVYLLLNASNKIITNTDNLKEIVIANSLIYSIYSDTNCRNLRLVELIKACLFLEYCQKHIPFHFEIFLKEYGLDKWQEYVLYLHQIGMLIIEQNINEPVKLISISIDDKDYAKKVAFFDKFCIQEIYQNDQDFTEIKSRPVEKNSETGDYRIVFEQFFVEKMYKSLYFIFKEINDSFIGSDKYINPTTFRSEIGFEFSEKILMNKILRDALGKKYKHLGYNELQKKGRPDYYIRDGKHILLFECKDNLIRKKVVESGDIEVFISEMKHIFLNNKEEKPKAIKQLINNIITIREGKFEEDNGINLNNNVIYPIIVTHNSIFSLPGINALLNDWFSTELEFNGINTNNIKDLTIIDIGTLVMYQGLFSQKNNSIRELIDSYWKKCKTENSKKLQTIEDVVCDFLIKYQPFNIYVDEFFKGKNFFTKEIKKYNDCFLDKN